MVGHLLLRGLAVGFVAGVLAFGFASVFGEPQIERAIAFEAQAGHEHADHQPMGHQHGDAAQDAGPELVSRATQASAGLFTGVVVYGAALGGLFSLVFAFVHGRFGRTGPRITAALLALGGFIAVALVPFLKYPASPPAVGSAESIGLRTQLFLAMLIVSVTALIFAVAFARRLWVRYGAWNATLIAGAVFVCITATAQFLLPDINEVPDQFSAVVLWRFRMASLGMHLVLWTAIGLFFGLLSERSIAGAVQFGRQRGFARPQG